jgi:spore coat polysaccharide biosynthesis protein SpsF
MSRIERTGGNTAKDRTKTVAIIQARMGSTRLPGKVLKDIHGETMLARVVRRTQRAGNLDEVVVATTVEPGDEPIVAECARLKVYVFRGSEEDVLDRYYKAARAHRADVVVRITSDCPLIEPEVIDRVVGAFLDARPDYASNTMERTYPRGLDIEVMTMAALERAWVEASEPYQRIHVTPYFYQNPDIFRLLSVRHRAALGEYRWTVDTPEDLAFVRQVYGYLGNGGAFSWREVLDLLDRKPELMALNREIRQKALHEG